MAGKLLGKDYTICRNPAPGTFAAPKFVPLINARDIKITQKPAAAFDSSDRTVQVRTVIPVRRNCEVSFTAIWNGGIGLTAIRDAYLAGTVIEMAVLQGQPGATAKGLFGDWIVSKFPIKFPLAGGQGLDILLKPAANYLDRVRIYTDTASTLGTPEIQAPKRIGWAASVNLATGVPVPTARDISWSLEWEEEEASDRAQENDGFGVAFEQYLPCLQKAEAEFEVIWNETVHAPFRAAFDGNLPVELHFLDGPFATVGSWGVHADWAITEFPTDAALNNGQLVKMKFQPHGNGTHAFQFVTMP